MEETLRTQVKALTEMKRELQQNIFNLIDEFENLTNLFVGGVAINRIPANAFGEEGPKLILQEVKCDILVDPNITINQGGQG